MKHLELSGVVRKVGNKATLKAFRAQELVPCNLYGQGIDNVLFTISEKEFNKILSNPNSFIIDLVLDNGEKHYSVIQELQFHPVTDRCLHVDFLKVVEDKPIAIDVPCRSRDTPRAFRRAANSARWSARSKFPP